MPIQYIILCSKNKISVRIKEFWRDKKMATKEKNVWILLVFILSGIVIGGLLGELASQVDWLWWLSYGESFGLSQPLTLDLSVIQLTFGLTFKINISSIIGMILAIFIYKKI